ncbi:MAG: hypothetical protein ABWY27_19300, partial [Telluria sp.]
MGRRSSKPQFTLAPDRRTINFPIWWQFTQDTELRFDSTFLCTYRFLYRIIFSKLSQTEISMYAQLVETGLKKVQSISEMG